MCDKCKVKELVAQAMMDSDLDPEICLNALGEMVLEAHTMLAEKDNANATMLIFDAATGETCYALVPPAHQEKVRMIAERVHKLAADEVGAATSDTVH